MSDIHITGDGNTVDSNNTVVYVQQRPKVGLFGAFFLFVLVAGLVAKFWMYLVAGVVLATLGYTCWSLVADRRKAKAELLARADAQHQATLRGDDQGTYGEFPPAV